MREIYDAVPAGLPQPGHRPAPWGERDRQGTHRPRHPTTTPRAPRAHSSNQLRRPSARRSWRASSLATRRGPSPGRPRSRRAGSSSPTEEACFSTRSEICPPIFRSSSCVSCRSVPLSASGNPDHRCGRAHHRGHAPGSGVPHGPGKFREDLLLSSERRPSPAAPASRASRRHPIAHGALPGQVQRENNRKVRITGRASPADAQPPLAGNVRELKTASSGW